MKSGVSGMSDVRMVTLLSAGYHEAMEHRSRSDGGMASRVRWTGTRGHAGASHTERVCEHAHSQSFYIVNESQKEDPSQCLLADATMQVGSCNTHPTAAALSLEALPSDILDEIIVNHLARAVRSVGSDAVAALDALGLTCSTFFAAIMRQRKAWEVAASGFLVVRNPTCARQLVHQITSAVATLTSRTHTCIATSTLNLHIMMLPRQADAGWEQRLYERLDAAGLAEGSLSGSARRTDWSTDRPFIFVPCDIADARMRPVIDADGRLRTYPCLSRNCLEPASRGCEHCSKHGGQGAAQVLKECMASSAHRHRHVIFVAMNGTVASAYRRAIVATLRAARAGTPVNQPKSSRAVKR